MADKVQLIKEEIERIEQILDDFKKTHNNTIDNGIVSAKKNICKHIKSFIDSLPEEPASEDLEEEVSNWRHNHFHGRRDKDASGEYLERKSQLDLARHFAEWQKQQMKEALQTEYEKGRFDMREEMMKDAVIAWVNTYESVTNPYDNEVSFITNLSPSKFKNKETVKIIIVKEN